MQTRFLSFAICLLGSTSIVASGCASGDTELASRKDVSNAQDGEGDGSGENASEPKGETSPAGGAGAGGDSPNAPGATEGSAGASGGDDGKSEEPEQEKPALPAPLASGVRLDKVVLYQGVAIPLMNAGQAVQQRNAPVVRGREALLRVHIAPTSGFAPKDVAVEVEFTGSNAPLPLRQVKTVRAASSEGDLGSTFNFEIPGAHMTNDLALSVAIRETKGEGPGGAMQDAMWPVDGKASLGANDSQGNLEIVIVPVRYQGDRSGRLPDTSPATMDKLRKRFQATYPIPDANITVREPIGFSEGFSRNGNGWSKLLSQTCSARQQDRPARNVYYYGMIMPATSFSSYCQGGCVTGLGNVVQQPNDEYGRCAIGLGFGDDRSNDTALHEIGHAMGRTHAPCGNPDGVDRGFPYSGASIGSWGYDFGAKQLREPSKFKDFLSYCEPQWVSDYTYRALFDRISYVNGSMSFYAEPTAVTRFRVALMDGEGHVEWGETIELSSTPSGELHELPVLDRDGEPAGTIEGYFYEYSHLPGGTMLVPMPKSSAVRAVELPVKNGNQVLQF